MKKNIAVLMGGYSHEAQISMKSGETVLKHIDSEKYNTVKIVIDEKGWNAHFNEQVIPVDKNDFSVTRQGEKIKFDLAFVVIHGTPGEDGKLQAYFDMIGMKYTTSGVLPLALTFNKYACNTYLQQLGIRCAKSIRITRESSVNPNEIANEIGLPMFIKPSDGGSSFGVTKVKSKEEIESAIQTALEHGTEAVIESFVNGTEVTCGIYHLGGKTTVLYPTEIVSENEFFDFDAKYKGLSQEITPARISEELTELIRNTTKKVYHFLALKGLSRVDYIIQNGEPFLIEVNSVPGLSDASIIPQQARHSGIALRDLFGAMIEDALMR